MAQEDKDVAVKGGSGQNYARASIIIAVIMIGIMFQSNTASFVVIIASIAGEMIPKGVMDPTQVGWIISLPALLMIVGVLLSGVLTTRFSMRDIMIVAWIIYGLAGLAIFWCPDAMTLFIMRGLMGFAIGLAQPSTKALPSRMYGGENRAKILGWIAMGGGIMSMAVSLIFGYVGLISWRFCMFFYPIYAVIVIIVALIFIPRLPPEKKQETAADAGAKRPMGMAAWLIVLVGLLLYIVASIIQVETSILVQENNLGGTDVTSWVSVCNTAGIVVGGIIFGRVYNKVGRPLFALSLLLAAACYFWFANSTTVIMLCISAFFANLFIISFVIPYIFTRISFIVPPERITTAITMLTLSTYLGQVITTPFINWVQGIWGATAAVALNAAGIGFVVLGVAVGLWTIFTWKKEFTMGRMVDKQPE